jgi:hypothetical protein
LRWEFEAATEREHEARERMVEQAWHTVRLWVRSHKSRGKESYLEVPALQDVLDEFRPKKPQTPAQMVAALKKAGLTVRKRKKRKSK